MTKLSLALFLFASSLVCPRLSHAIALRTPVQITPVQITMVPATESATDVGDERPWTQEEEASLGMALAELTYLDSENPIQLIGGFGQDRTFLACRFTSARAISGGEPVTYPCRDIVSGEGYLLSGSVSGAHAEVSAGVGIVVIRHPTASAVIGSYDCGVAGATLGIGVHGMMCGDFETRSRSVTMIGGQVGVGGGLAFGSLTIERR